MIAKLIFTVNNARKSPCFAKPEINIVLNAKDEMIGIKQWKFKKNMIVFDIGL